MNNYYCKHLSIKGKSLRKDHCYNCSPQNFCYHKNPDTPGRKTNCYQCSPQYFCFHKNPDIPGQKINCYQCSPQRFCSCCKMIRKYIEDYCAKCYYYKNPNLEKADKVRKEDYFNELFKEMYPNLYNMITLKDKIVSNDCGIRRRPDMLLNVDNKYYIDIEFDENQHKSYNLQCMIARDNEIAELLKFKLVIYIRLNPDTYYYEDEEKRQVKVKSCFDLTKKTGKLKCNKGQLKNRMKYLKKRIDYWLNPNNVKDYIDKEIKIEEKIFYDGFKK